jgi:hypothetical protein
VIARDKMPGDLTAIVDKIADTAVLVSEQWASFELMDGRGLVEVLIFEKPVLKSRRDDRPPLGPLHREF